MKTLKGKLTYIYIFLVFIIAVVGVSSVINFYSLSKSINGLMVDNYRSISAVNNMTEALQDQNQSLLSYINTGSQNSISSFYENGNAFSQWFSIENSNITEPGESSLVNNVNRYYVNYQTLATKLQNIRDTLGGTPAFEYYNTKIVPSYQRLRTELKKITVLNETAMFKSKSNATKSVTQSMYIIMILSLCAILIGFFSSRFFTNRFLKPLYVLKEKMKAVKEGYIDQDVTLISDDEIGELSGEFNRMLSRLRKFEKSTKGMLFEEKNKSVAIVKSIADPLIVLDTDFKTILVNHACEIFFNIKEEEALDKHFLEVIRYNDVFDHILKLYSETEDKYVPKIITVKTNEKDFYFDTIVTKIRNENNAITGLVILFQNVTKLKKLENTKTQFVSTISHEFKTPLTSIMIGTGLIKNGGVGELNDKQIEIIKTIEDDTARLSTLVNDIIQLAKIESDRAFYHFKPCSIYGIAENCLKAFLEQATLKEINLYSEINENLPKVNVDYEKISWVINNLISNAIKYTDAGDYIMLNAYVKNKTMYISVKDTGRGIPEEYVERIFDRFFKVSSYNSETYGSGLGLAIAKEIIETHKGTIWCESKLDEGSTFTFTLPL